MQKQEKETKECSYYREQCSDCLECYSEIECFYRVDHGIELQYKLQEELMEKEKQNE